MAVVSVSLPETLIEEMDRLMKNRGYAGRSELVRAALRDFLTRESQTPAASPGDAPRSATLTLVYPEGQERRMGEIRHTYSEIVKSMLHAHTTTHCVEVFILTGKHRRIREFTDRLRAERQANLVQAIYTDVPEAPGEPGGHAHE